MRSTSKGQPAEDELACAFDPLRSAEAVSHLLRAITTYQPSTPNQVLHKITPRCCCALPEECGSFTFRFRLTRCSAARGHGAV